MPPGRLPADSPARRTAFSQTEHLDRWAADGATFVFGIQAVSNLYELAENLPRNAWQELVRPLKHRVKTGPRKRPENVKQQVVKTGRRIVFGLLAWNRWLPVFFNLLDERRVPMRC